MWKPRSNPNVDPRHKLPLASPPRVRVPTAMPILVGVWHKTGCCFKFARNVWSECSFLVGSRGTQCTYLFFVVTPCSSCQQHLGGKRTIWLLHVVNMGGFFCLSEENLTTNQTFSPPPRSQKLSWSLKFWVFAQNVYVCCLFFSPPLSPKKSNFRGPWSFGFFLLKMSMFLVFFFSSPLSPKKSNFHGPWNLVVFCSKCLCLLSYYSPLCPTRSQTFMVLEIWWFFAQNVYVCYLFTPLSVPQEVKLSWSLKFGGFFLKMSMFVVFFSPLPCHPRSQTFHGPWNFVVFLLKMSMSFLLSTGTMLTTSARTRSLGRPSRRSRRTPGRRRRRPWPQRHRTRGRSWGSSSRSYRSVSQGKRQQQQKECLVGYISDMFQI